MSSGKKAATGAAGAAKATSPQANSTAAAASAAAAAAAPATPSARAFVASIPADLAVGCQVRVETALGASLIGTVFALDSEAGLLVLQLAYDFDDARNDATRPISQGERAVGGEGKKDWSVLNMKQIRVEVTAPPPSTPRTLPPLSLPAIAAKVEHNMESRNQEKLTIGIGVAPEAQRLFDAIRKTTPAIWSPDYQSFIVLDSVRVGSPFTAQSCSVIGPPPGVKLSKTQATHADTMLTRVKKIVESERSRLKM